MRLSLVFFALPHLLEFRFLSLKQLEASPQNALICLNYLLKQVNSMWNLPNKISSFNVIYNQFITRLKSTVPISIYFFTLCFSLKMCERNVSAYLITSCISSLQKIIPFSIENFISSYLIISPTHYCINSSSTKILLIFQ